MLQIVAVSLICSFIVIYLNNINKELAFLTIIMSGVIIVFMAINELNEIFGFFNKIVDLTGIEKDVYKIIFKITAIGYLFEFSASMVEDFGLKSLSSKLIFAGKIIILVTSLPILYAVLDLIMELQI